MTSSSASGEALPSPRRWHVVQAAWQRAGHLWQGSVYLVLNNVAASALGFAGWLVISRTFSSSDVGRAGAVISTISLVVNIALLGVPNTLVRFLPTSGARAELLSAALLATVPLTILLALGTGIFAGETDGGRSWWVALFVVSAVLLTVKAILEASTTAHRGARRLMMATTAGNALKLVAALAVGAALAGSMAIVVLQLTVPVLSILILGHDLHQRGLLRRLSRPRWRTLRRYGGYSGATYVNGLVGGLPGLALPGLVLHRLGPAQAGGWYLSMLIAGVLFLVPAAVGQALLVEGSHDEDSLHQHVRKASFGIAAVMVPTTMLAMALAPVILSVFGSDYVGAATCLRLLMCSALLVSANYVAGTVLAVRRRIQPLIVTNIANAAVVLVLFMFWSRNLDQAGWAWLAGEIVNVALFVGFARWMPPRKVA